MECETHSQGLGTLVCVCVCMEIHLYISLYGGGPLIFERERLVVLAGPLVCIPHTQEGY